eukprot:jgi/Tetstr1/432874/TSEL_022223.t1
MTVAEPVVLASPRSFPAGAERRARYARSAALGSECLPCAIPSSLHLRRGSVSATLALFPVRGATPVVKPARAPRVPQAKYMLDIQTSGTNPWAATMRPYMRSELGSDQLGETALHLYALALAETTASSYDSVIRPFLQFCGEQGVPPLDGTAATAARYITWQGLRETVKAATLQPYLPAINGFFRDHGAEPVAQGDLISKARAANAAYAIGVVMQKIKRFGGWAQVSSVVLDYINPTALPCAASWQLYFGWLIPRQAARPWAA